MPTRKLKDVVTVFDTSRKCQHPEHEPPKLQAFEPGLWEHTCPACECVMLFAVVGEKQTG